MNHLFTHKTFPCIHRFGKAMSSKAFSQSTEHAVTILVAAFCAAPILTARGYLAVLCVSVLGILILASSQKWDRGGLIAVLRGAFAYVDAAFGGLLLVAATRALDAMYSHDVRFAVAYALIGTVMLAGMVLAMQLARSMHATPTRH